MKLVKICILFFFIFFVTGCWDAVELEEQAYVVAMGVDLSEGEFIDITFQIANPQKGSSQLSEAQKEPPYTIITVTATDRSTAKDLANVSVSRRINLNHLKVILLSEDFAKSEKFTDFVEALMRDPRISREINLMVTKEKTSEFLKKNKPPMETRPHKNYEFMTERYKDTGLVTLSTLDRLLRKTNENVGAFTAIYATATELDPKSPEISDNYYPGQVPKQGDNPAQMIGTVVISHVKMIGSLTGAETRLMLNMWPNAKAKNWLQAFPDPIEPDKHIAARVLKKETPKIKVQTKGQLKIEVDVSLNLEINNISSYINYVTDMKKQKELTNSIEKYLEENSYKLIEKAQKELKVDIFNWFYIARKNFWTLDDYKNYNYEEKFPDAEVKVKFHVTVKQFGKDMNPPSLKKIKE